MHLRTQRKPRRDGLGGGIRWALAWTAVALIAAPLVGSFIDRHGR